MSLTRIINMRHFLCLFLCVIHTIIASAFVTVNPMGQRGSSSVSRLAFQRRASHLAASFLDNAFLESSSQELMAEETTMPGESDYAQKQQSAIGNEKVILGAMGAAALSCILFQEFHTNPIFAHQASLVLSTFKHLPLQVWDSYESALASHPVAVKGATSATVYGLGDILSQKTTNNGEKLDNGRILRSVIAGGVGHGPLSHVWYNLSESFFTHIGLATAWWSFIPKIVVDQSVWGPIWNSLYILMIGLMQAEPIGKMKNDIQSNTIPLIVEGLKLWPLAHCVTYGLVPVENRLLWVDTVEILWVSILATKAAAMTHSPAAADEKNLESSTVTSM